MIDREEREWRERKKERQTDRHQNEGWADLAGVNVRELSRTLGFRLTVENPTYPKT